MEKFEEKNAFSAKEISGETNLDKKKEFDRLAEYSRSITHRAKSVMGEGYAGWIMGKKNNFDRNLIEKYSPEICVDYVAFHVLGDSSDYEKASKTDFPGEDSVELFFRRLDEELDEMEKKQ